jgi:hypothetical protein
VLKQGATLPLQSFHAKGVLWEEPVDMPAVPDEALLTCSICSNSQGEHALNVAAGALSYGTPLHTLIDFFRDKACASPGRGVVGEPARCWRTLC